MHEAVDLHAPHQGRNRADDGSRSLTRSNPDHESTSRRGATLLESKKRKRSTREGYRIWDTQLEWVGAKPVSAMGRRSGNPLRQLFDLHVSAQARARRSWKNCLVPGLSPAARHLLRNTFQAMRQSAGTNGVRRRIECVVFSKACRFTTDCQSSSLSPPMKRTSHWTTDPQYSASIEVQCNCYW